MNFPPASNLQPQLRSAVMLLPRAFLPGRQPVIFVNKFNMLTGAGDQNMEGSWEEHEARKAAAEAEEKAKAAKEAEELREKVRFHDF